MEEVVGNRIVLPMKYWLIVLALASGLFYRLGSWGVIDTSEARYAEISRKMVVSGDYLHPTYLGIEHYHKPPMTYWITSAAFHLFGVNPFAARFFLQIAFLIQILLTYKIADQLFQNSTIRLYAAGIFACLLIVFVSIRNLTTDAYLNTFLMAASYFLILFLKQTKTAALYLFSLFAALAFLTKITAVFVYLGPIILCLLWYYRENLRFSWHLFGALALGLLVSLSWFILLQIEGKEVLKYMLYDQSVVRYSSDTFNRSMPFYFYFGATALLSFPWVFLTLVRQVKRMRQSFKLDIVIVLLTACFLVPILFFSLSHSKLLLYILPAFWVLAVLSGKILDDLTPAETKIWLKFEVSYFALILVGLALAPFIESNLQTSAGFWIWLSIVIILLSIFLSLSNVPSKEKLVGSGLIFALGITLISTHFLSENETNASTGKGACDWITQNNLSDRELYLYDKLAPSFAFHLDKDVALIGKSEERELQFEQTESWKSFYFDLNIPARKQALISRLKTPSLLVARRKRVPQIEEEILSQFEHSQEIGLWTIYY
jgi:4-amino-4-deoxy-L-arabinose transferase